LINLLVGKGEEVLTIGRRINPTHSAERDGFDATIPLILATRNSAVNPTKTVSSTMTPYSDQLKRLHPKAPPHDRGNNVHLRLFLLFLLSDHNPVLKSTNLTRFGGMRHGMIGRSGTGRWRDDDVAILIVLLPVKSKLLSHLSW